MIIEIFGGIFVISENDTGIRVYLYLLEAINRNFNRTLLSWMNEILENSSVRGGSFWEVKKHKLKQKEELPFFRFKASDLGACFFRRYVISLFSFSIQY